MIGSILVRIIDIIANLLVLVVIVNSLLSYFLSPYHPFRSALERIVSPMLTPIRRVIPMAGMIDFSPVVLIILIEIASYILKNLLSVL